MSATMTNRELLTRIRAHTRPGSAAERASLPRGDEVIVGCHHNGTSAMAMFLTKYGRTDLRGQIRTVLLTDDGEAWNLITETVALPTPETRAQCEDPAEADDIAEMKRRRAIIDRRMREHGSRIESLQRALQAEEEAFARLMDEDDALREAITEAES